MSGSLRSQRNDDDNQYVLVAYIDNVRNVSHLLKAIHFKELATICASENGLKVTVEDSKCVQANAFIQAAIFQEYTVKEESVVFKVNLSVLLECINIFGSSNIPSSTTALKLCYAGYGSPLILLLEESGVLTDCKLQTLEPEDILDFEFSPTNVVNKIIMKDIFNSVKKGDITHILGDIHVKDGTDSEVRCPFVTRSYNNNGECLLQSEVLREAWSDLDMNSDVLQILMSPNKPYFELSTKGNAGTVLVNFSKTSDMIESFHCTQTQTNRYQIFLLKPSLKALAQSTKVSIRTDDRGFLCLQYMVKTEDGHICFVEYVCTPDEDVEIDASR